MQNNLLKLFLKIFFENINKNTFSLKKKNVNTSTDSCFISCLKKFSTVKINDLYNYKVISWNFYLIQTLAFVELYKYTRYRSFNWKRIVVVDVDAWAHSDSQSNSKKYIKWLYSWNIGMLPSLFHSSYKRIINRL